MGGEGQPQWALAPLETRMGGMEGPQVVLATMARGLPLGLGGGNWDLGRGVLPFTLGPIKLREGVVGWEQGGELGDGVASS